MEQYLYQLYEEDFIGNYPSECPSSRSQHQTNLQRNLSPAGLSRTLVIAFQLLVRGFLFHLCFPHSRFSNSLELLRTFYAEGLVDRKFFLSWLGQQMLTCNLAQAGFIARLADEYLEGVMHSQPLARPLIQASVSKLSEIRTTFAKDTLGDTDALLVTILQRLCVVIPDAFVSPRTWRMHRTLLCEALSQNMHEHSSDEHSALVAQRTRGKVLTTLQDIKNRNEALLFYNLPSLASAKLGTAVADIEVNEPRIHRVNLENLPLFVAT
jgi:mediator of RNA polymerase II transcription subunit 12, fungi type